MAGKSIIKKQIENILKGHTLNLTIKKRWFDMILSGEKLEEYREIKPYWISRLTFLSKEFNICTPKEIEYHCEYENIRHDIDMVNFRNGYSKDSPTLKIICEGIVIGEGKPEWGGESGKNIL